MKKYLFMAAACLGLLACEQEKPVKPTPEPDSITLDAGKTEIKKEVSNAGGKPSVMVTSSADWKLEGQEYDWVTPDKTEGKDAETVVFTVAPNTDFENDRTATYKFICGEATATLTIVSLHSEKPAEVLELLSPAVVDLGYDAGEVKINVRASIGWEVTYQIKDNPDWINFRTKIADNDDETLVELVFPYQALEGLEDRQTEITIFGQDADPVKVNLTQYAKHVLSVEGETSYAIDPDGETINVSVTSNVEYTATSSADWLTVAKTETGISLTAAAGDNGDATVTLRQSDATGEEIPLEVVLNVSQVNSLVKYAVNMTDAKLFSKFEGMSNPYDWDAPEMVLMTATYECLVKFNSFRTISTIMGQEGKLLLRLGDKNPNNILEVVTKGGSAIVDFKFETGKWYHIAATYEARRNSSSSSWYTPIVTVYINGNKVKLAGSNQKPAFPSDDYTFVGAGKQLSDSQVDFASSRGTQWNVGFSFNEDRYMDGLITEIRVWNKILTEQDVKAENHFYTVDPKSDGLLTYWKPMPKKHSYDFSGAGTPVEYDAIEDLARGHWMYGQRNLNGTLGEEIKPNNYNIDFVKVALPEK